MTAHQSAICPYDASQDDRKSARIAAERMVMEDGTQVVTGFAEARGLLRNNAARQGMTVPSKLFEGEPAHAPVIFLEGEHHRKKRAAIARFFTPKAISTRYQAVMEATTDRLLQRFQVEGQAYLDRISFELAVEVAADILGLTESNPRTMAKRIEAMLTAGLAKPQGRVAHWVAELMRRYRALAFYYCDVRPVMKLRKSKREEDVISHLIDEGYSVQGVLIECMTYASAGMVTTREFITMAAWHFFERDGLRERFLSGDEAEQLAILEEILRLEPVAGALYRRAPDASTNSEGVHYTINVRAANTDEQIIGSCPRRIDPDRGQTLKGSGSGLSFGDGNHRCPGAQVALHESRVFLDRLFRIPGLRLTREPTIGWCQELLSYELRDAIIECDRVRA